MHSEEQEQKREGEEVCGVQYREVHHFVCVRMTVHVTEGLLQLLSG